MLLADRRMISGWVRQRVELARTDRGISPPRITRRANGDAAATLVQ
jgi:hypothetical protein